MTENRSYFMRRAAQERSAADNASTAVARQAHLELARRYRDRLKVSKAPAQAALSA